MSVSGIGAVTLGPRLAMVVTTGKVLSKARGLATTTGGAVTPSTARSGVCAVVTCNAVALVAAPSTVARVILAVAAGPGMMNVTSVGDEATATATNAPTFTTGTRLTDLRLCPITDHLV